MSSNGTVRLRYTGPDPKIFTGHGIGEVAKGDEFDVPAGEAERFTRRGDIEVAAKGKPKAVPKTEDGASEAG